MKGDKKVDEEISFWKQFGLLLVVIVGFVGYMFIILKQKVKEIYARRFEEKTRRILNIYQRRG